MIYTLSLNPALDRELTVVALETNTVLRATQARADYGGKGFNVSRALAALGTPSVALGLLGGPTGAALKAGLSRLGISVDVVAIAGETRTNVSIVATETGDHIKVNEAGPIVTPEERETLVDRISALARPGDLWVLAGSLPPGLPPDLYASLVELLRGYGARVILDASGEAFTLGCRARPYLIKPNAVEAEAATGLVADTAEAALAAADRLRALGPENVVISRGAAGAVLATADGHWVGTPPHIAEANPIGAGDALVAGLVQALNLNASWADVLRLGLACGAAAAGLPGTDFGDLDHVARLAAQAVVREV